MTLAILSPHRDDAAFSCGIALHLACEAALPVSILNIFTQSDYAPYAQLEGVVPVSALRHAEDWEMLGKLPAPVELRDLAWPDAPVRRGIAPEETLDPSLDRSRFNDEVVNIANQLQGLVKEKTCVLVPLANQHLDHKVARAAAERCVPPERLAYYEDLPYFARLTPEARAVALRTFVPPSTQATMLAHPYGSALKRELASAYVSQIDDATNHEIVLYASKRGRQTGAAPSHSNALAGAEVIYAGPEARDVLASLGAKTRTP